MSTTTLPCVIGHRGCTIKKKKMSPEQIQWMTQQLTVSPVTFQPKGCKVPIPSFPVYMESSTKYFIPLEWLMQQTEDSMSPFYNVTLDMTWKPRAIESYDASFAGSLRPLQEEAIQAYMTKTNKDHRGGLICIQCGGGKTVIGLNMIARMKMKTLIVVHKTFLLDQWKERIAQFLPDARVGTIMGPTFDVEDKDIVIGMLQTLSMKDFPQNAFEGFGLSLYDEAHHLSAEVFSRALCKAFTPHRLGLTATPDRKDGLTKVFKMFLGPIVFIRERQNDSNVEVRMIHYSSDDRAYANVPTNYMGQTNTSAMITQISGFFERNQMIGKYVDTMLQEEPERQILVLSDRRQQLTWLHDHFTSHYPQYSVGYYLGGMKQEALATSATKKLILATYAMSAEGMDIPTLDTLIMVSPKSDIEQSVGRILRRKPEDRDRVPIVVDVCDSLDPTKNQQTKRKRFYKKNKYIVADIDVECNTPSSPSSMIDITCNETCRINYNESSKAKKKASKGKKKVAKQLDITQCFL